MRIPAVVASHGLISSNTLSNLFTLVTSDRIVRPDSVVRSLKTPITLGRPEALAPASVFPSGT